jgi:hypothetical protein
MPGIEVLESLHAHFYARRPKVQIAPGPSDKMSPIAVSGNEGGYDSGDPEKNGRNEEYRIKEHGSNNLHNISLRTIMHPSLNTGPKSTIRFRVDFGMIIKNSRLPYG